jgi:hypothetical protein
VGFETSRSEILVTMPLRGQESRSRGPILALVTGCALVAVSVPLAALAGGPYLSLDRLSPWLVVFAIGLFVAMFAIPFALHAGLGRLLEDDARWERALLWWGAIALAVLAAGLVVGIAAGFAGDSLAGSLAAVVVAEAILVLATLIAWLVSG